MTVTVQDVAVENDLRVAICQPFDHSLLLCGDQRVVRIGVLSVRLFVRDLENVRGAMLRVIVRVLETSLLVSGIDKEEAVVPGRVGAERYVMNR